VNARTGSVEKPLLLLMNNALDEKSGISSRIYKPCQLKRQRGLPKREKAGIILKKASLDERKDVP
jgi:hypothetical protein